MTDQKPIGPTWPEDLKAAGLMGLPFSWDVNGNFFYSDEMTEAQIQAVEAAYAAHDPTQQVNGTA